MIAFYIKQIVKLMFKLCIYNLMTFLRVELPAGYSPIYTKEKEKKKIKQ